MFDDTPTTTQNHTILSSFVNNNHFFNRALSHFKKEYFDEPEYRVVFNLISDYAAEYNKPPTKVELEVDLSCNDVEGCTDENMPKVQHIIRSLSDIPVGTDWLIEQAEQLYVKNAVMPAMFKIINDVKAGNGIDVSELQDIKKFSFKDSDGTKLKLDTITHTFEQGKTLREQLTNPSYRIKHMLPENGVGVLTGPSTTGKTFMIDHMLAHLVTGRTYFGKRVKPCNVLYVYAEGSSVDIDLRLEAHTQHYGNDDFNTKNHRLYIAPCIWNLCDESIMSEIMDYIIKHEIKFVVLETLGAMLMDGTVNDDEVVRKYLAGAKKIADQCNCTLLIVHHPPKGGTSDYLGSVTIKNNPDFLWILWKLDEEGKRNDDYKATEIMLELYCEKCKFGPDGWKYNLLRKEIVIGIDDEGDEMTSLVVENLTPEEKAEMIETGKVESAAAKAKAKVSTNTYAIKLETIRKDCFEGRDIISKAELKKAAKGHTMTKADGPDTLDVLAKRGVEALQKAGVKVDIVGQDIVWNGVASVVMDETMFS
jgi:RecA-family ATPase